MLWEAWIVGSVLLGPLLFAGATALAHRTPRPGIAVAVVLIGLVALALTTYVAVAALAWSFVARSPFVATIGGWRTAGVDPEVGIPVAVSLAAAIVGIALLVRLGVVLTVLTGKVRDERRAAALLAGVPEILRTGAEDPYAYAFPGWGFRAHVVVSAGMRDLLDSDELDAVVAHERAHLRQHHDLLRGVARVTVAMNPLLRKSRRDLDLLLERSADDAAARETDPLVLGRALGRASLAQIDHRRAVANAERCAFGTHGVATRIAALTDSPSAAPRLALLACSAVGVVVAASAMRALERSEDLVEALQHFH